MDDNQLLRTIDNYIAGKASMEEIRQLNRWLNTFNGNPGLLSSLSAQELKNIAGKMLAAITETLNAHPDETGMPS